MISPRISGNHLATRTATIRSRDHVELRPGERSLRLRIDGRLFENEPTIRRVRYKHLVEHRRIVRGVARGLGPVQNHGRG